MTEQLVRPAALVDRVGPTTCQIYVVRHGTTTMNVENRYRGRRDVPLDAQGYQDAVDAARQLSGVGLAAVYTARCDAQSQRPRSLPTRRACLICASCTA